MEEVIPTENLGDGNMEEPEKARKRRNVWAVRNKVAPEKVEFAKNLRKNPTITEALLWGRLKGKKLEGRQFSRQKVIFGWIVDFYCASENLVVELDGTSHFGKEDKDLERDQVMTAAGFRILRFKNEEVKTNIEYVVEKIRTTILGVDTSKPIAQPEQTSITKPGGPVKRRRVPSCYNTFVDSDGNFWHWDSKGFRKIEPRVNANGETVVDVNVKNVIRERIAKDLLEEAFAIKEENPVQKIRLLKMEALALQTAAEFLLENYVSGPVGFRKIKSVANKLLHQAKQIYGEAEALSSRGRSYKNNT